MLAAIQRSQSVTAPTRSDALSQNPKSFPEAGPATLWASVRQMPAVLVERIVAMSSTRANYWLEFAFSSTLSAGLLGAGVRSHRGSWTAAFLTVFAGLVVFSFIEYLFHRWIFHGPDSMYSRGHAAHHRLPQGYDALPFFLPAAILSGLALLLWLVLPADYACLVAGTIGFGYVAYGFSHYAIHATRFRHPWIRRWAALHHIHHHHPDRNFGVTTALWDHILGTRYQSGRPRRH